MKPTTTFAYMVVRHGGRRTDEWRKLIETNNRDEADAVYNREFAKIRQGTVALVESATGKAIRQEMSGNWRTRP